jgi:hypothetical protein
VPGTHVIDFPLIYIIKSFQFTPIPITPVRPGTHPRRKSRANCTLKGLHCPADSSLFVRGGKVIDFGPSPKLREHLILENKTQRQTPNGRSFINKTKDCIDATRTALSGETHKEKKLVT